MPFLDLGSAPPSNAYLTKETVNTPETWLPLRLLVCKNCWLAQTDDYAGRDVLFDREYAYFSSFSTTWLSHAERYVRQMIQRFGLHSSSLVVEVAANDGYLLQYVQQAGIPCFGIEPTASTASAARAKGIEIIEQFFGKKLADELARKGQQADLIVANNVLAHVPDIHDFVSGFPRLLHPQGIVTFEFPHLLRMVQENQFDTAYHEHYSYLSLTAVVRIFAENGLEAFDVEELPTHGGSLRVYAQHSNTGSHPCGPAIENCLAAEATAGMRTPNFYRDFQQKAEKIKDDLVMFLIDSKRQGLNTVAYGAAAKGTTLLNFAGVRPDLLPYVADMNPAKQGKYLPGSRIPIVDEAFLRADHPDQILVLPWNIANEVRTQLADTRARFVTAIPTLQIL